MSGDNEQEESKVSGPRVWLGADSGHAARAVVCRAGRTEGRTTMHFPRRDLLATGLVAVAGFIYVLWTLDVVSNVRVAGIVMLVCGFAASASAVVPGFDDLLRGNKAYLVLTSLIGLLAVFGGAAILFAASGTGLTLVMAAMAVLWAIATVHHLLLAAPSRAQETPHTSTPGPQPTTLSH